LIELRDFVESDKERLVELANNENVSRYLAHTFPYPYTVNDATWWIETGSKAGINKAIIYNGEFAGSVGAEIGVGERARQASVGYWLGEPYWGKGIALVALKELLSYLSKNTDIFRLHAWVYEPNIRSARVLEKSGFKLEATLQNSLSKQGQMFNELIYSKTNS